MQTQEALRGGEQKDVSASDVGYAVQEQTKFKHSTYNPLLAIANHQATNGARAKSPTFIAAVVSTFGEFGLETIKLQEALTNAYARKLSREGNRQDGFSVQRLTAEYRNKFRNRLHIAVAKGIGRMINTCGLPVTLCRKYQNIVK